MRHIIITITGNSNKRLDIQAQTIIKIARETGAVKAGPIPLKGKRIVHIYNINRKTLDKLMYMKHDKKLNYDVDDCIPNQEGLRYVSPEVGYVDQDEEYY